jgi:salicylate hydroxylase
LIELGLAGALSPQVVAPAALRVLAARTGREIVCMPLRDAEQRYGAPYWMIHRGDLQAVLGTAAAQTLDIAIKFGMRMEDFATHPNGVTVSARGRAGLWNEYGTALIAADGLWSAARARFSLKDSPRFAGRTAWRALVAAHDVAAEFRAPLIHLWLGRDAHLVHYPVRGGSLINIVVITADHWNAPGWSEPASRADLLPRIRAARWAPQAQALIEAPDAWLRWALYDRRPLSTWSVGAAALLGDAAHPMLPFLAQGAAMAIEDAAVAAQCLHRFTDDAALALRTYAALRRARVARVQRLAARNGARYHLGGLRAMLRDAALRSIGGERLLRHYDWLYDWRPPPALPTP